MHQRRAMFCDVFLLSEVMKTSYICRKMILQYSDKYMSQWKFMNDWKDSKKGSQVLLIHILDSHRLFCVEVKEQLKQHTVFETEESTLGKLNLK
jgi:hypothetical protein